MNIADVLDQDLKKYGEYVQWVFADEGKEFTNVEFDRLARRLANGLRGLGVKKGDRVTVLSHTCPEILMTYLACFKMGTVINPVIYVLPPEEIAYILNDQGTGTIITNSPLYREKIEGIIPKIPSLKNVILIDRKLPNTILLQDLVDQGSVEFKNVECDDDDVGMLIYTAGTTGNPKGVMKTQRNLFWEFYWMAKEYLAPGENTRELTMLAVMPLSHAMGSLMTLVVYALGNRVIVLRKFDLEQTLKAITKYQVKYIGIVPTIAVRLLAHPEGEKVLRDHPMTIEMAGAPVPVEVAKRLIELGHRVLVGYGQTEANSACNDTLAIPYDPYKRPGAIGMVIMPGTEVRIFDENDNELPIGEVGELVIRGPIVMKGYWNKPELTEKALHGGWLHTGDIGWRDMDGFFYIGPRKDDLIIRGGNNIYPAEIEDVLYTHPKIADASVIGVPDETMGEEIGAFVTLKPGEETTPQEILEFCRQRLAKFKVPKYLEIIDAMPLSSAGKILKRELRKRHMKNES